MNWSGHGLMDLTGYDAYFSGKLSDYSLPQETIESNIKGLGDLPKPSDAKTGKW